MSSASSTGSSNKVLWVAGACVAAAAIVGGAYLLLSGDEEESSSGDAVKPGRDGKGVGAAGGAAGAGAGAGGGKSTSGGGGGGSGAASGSGTGAGGGRSALASPATTGGASGSGASGASDSDAGAGGGEVSKEMLVTLLRHIVTGAQQILVQVAEENQREPTGAKDHVNMVFLERVQELERNIYAHHGVSGAAVEAATERYAADEDVAQLGNHLHQLCTAISGPPMPELPADLTADKFAGIFKAYMATVQESFLRGLEEAKGAGLSGMDLLQKVNDVVVGDESRSAQEAVLTGAGLTEPVFQAALQKYQEHPEVFAEMERLTKFQQQKLTEATRGDMGGGRA